MILLGFDKVSWDIIVRVVYNSYIGIEYLKCYTDI